MHSFRLKKRFISRCSGFLFREIEERKTLFSSVNISRCVRMAPSFSNAKLLSAFVVDGLSVAISRRGYAAASQSVVRGGGLRSGVMAKKSEDTVSEKSPWVPDPVTGCYRPENRSNEIDVAELRDILLKHKEN